MYNDLIANVQLHLDRTFKVGSDLIGEFFDSTKRILIQNYQCAHKQGDTVLVIVIYNGKQAVVNYVDDSFIIGK